jgi:hypothetical protein
MAGDRGRLGERGVPMLVAMRQRSGKRCQGVAQERSRALVGERSRRSDWQCCRALHLGSVRALRRGNERTIARLAARGGNSHGPLGDRDQETRPSCSHDRNQSDEIRSRACQKPRSVSRLSRVAPAPLSFVVPQHSRRQRNAECWGAGHTVARLVEHPSIGPGHSRTKGSGTKDIHGSVLLSHHCCIAWQMPGRRVPCRFFVGGCRPACTMKPLNQ